MHSVRDLELIQCFSKLGADEVASHIKYFKRAYIRGCTSSPHTSCRYYKAIRLPLLTVLVFRTGSRHPALQLHRILPLPLARVACIQAVRLISDLLHRHLPQEEQREEARAAEPDHGLPHRRHAARERGAHLAAQWFGQRADDGDRGVRDLDALRELGEEGGGELRFELVLED